MIYDNSPLRSVQTLKKRVIKRRVWWELKKWDVLAKAILAYEKSQITKDKLWDIFNQFKY